MMEKMEIRYENMASQQVTPQKRKKNKKMKWFLKKSSEMEFNFFHS